MPVSETTKWITSKDVLQRAGISRATLNNYIKMGIVPKPIIQRPDDPDGAIRKMGYFPPEVISRVEKVKRLKSEGCTMEEIVGRLGNAAIEKDKESAVLAKPVVKTKNEHFDAASGDIYGKEVRLSLDYMSFASYVLNYNFEFVWINDEAEKKIFWHGVSRIGGVEGRNVFKLLFNWEFHSRIKNWKDLLSFHMAFVKEKYAKTWIKKLYAGISKSEVALLEDIYEKVPMFTGDSIKENHINLLMMDGTTNAYRVFTVSFREGILFSYVPLSHVV